MIYHLKKSTQSVENSHNCIENSHICIGLNIASCDLHKHNWNIELVLFAFQNKEHNVTDTI